MFLVGKGSGGLRSAAWWWVDSAASVVDLVVYRGSSRKASGDIGAGSRLEVRGKSGTSSAVVVAVVFSRVGARGGASPGFDARGCVFEAVSENRFSGLAGVASGATLAAQLSGQGKNAIAAACEA